MHKCKGCKYYYETLCDESKSIYDPLFDGYRRITVEIEKPCCGYNPGGVILDPDSPHCNSYDKKI